MILIFNQNMKKTSQAVLILLLISFLLPKLAMASWWNPSTWFIGEKNIKSETLESNNGNQTTDIAEPLGTSSVSNVNQTNIRPIISAQDIDLQSELQTAVEKIQNRDAEIKSLKTALANLQKSLVTANIQCKQTVVEKPVETIVYRDRIVEKPVDRIVYQDRVVQASCNNNVIPTPIQSPTMQLAQDYVMPDKPIIGSFCDNKGNCACSSVAGSNSNCVASSNNTVHVGETLNFTIKVSGKETSGILAFILPQEYDWVKEGGMKPWGTNLTYTKTFTTEDISARYFMYAYIKSSNDNYHRRSSGCNWTAYSCDDNANIIYTVLP